jgi:prepilin-type N-terminal cleavage/methylation domain-containing protein
LQPSNDRGFTLIEVLIAMVVLTVALVSLAELMAITLRLQQLGRNQTSAVRLAQDKIDELMSQNFTAAQLTVGGSLTADQANHFDDPTPAGGGNSIYKRRWTVANTTFVDQGNNGGAMTNVAAGSTRVVTVRVIPLVGDRRISPAVDLVTVVRCWPCP